MRITDNLKSYNLISVAEQNKIIKFIKENREYKSKNLIRMIQRKFKVYIYPQDMRKLRYKHKCAANKTEDLGMSVEVAFKGEYSETFQTEVIDKYGLIGGRPPNIDMHKWKTEMTSYERRSARETWKINHNEEYKQHVKTTREEYKKRYESKRKNTKCKKCETLIDPRNNKSGLCQNCYLHSLRKPGAKSFRVKCLHSECDIMVLRNSKHQLCRKHYVEKRYSKK